MKLTTAIKVLQKDADFLGMSFVDFFKFVQINWLIHKRQWKPTEYLLTRPLNCQLEIQNEIQQNRPEYTCAVP